MKKTIKLRDITPTQWDKNRKLFCKHNCDECIFGLTSCVDSLFRGSWVNHKDLYSDKFLNQEIEIEIKDNILTPKEKTYLGIVIEPFKQRVVNIKKVKINQEDYEFIVITVKNSIHQCEDEVILPEFPLYTAFIGMENEQAYTLTELELE